MCSSDLSVLFSKARVVPRSVFACASLTSASSYQFDAFVASVLVSSTARRSAVYVVVPSNPVLRFWSVVEALSALLVVLRRLTMCPESSLSLSLLKSDSDEDGGGGAGFRATPFGARFFKTTGADIVIVCARDVLVVMVLWKGCRFTEW